MQAKKLNILLSLFTLMIGWHTYGQERPKVQALNIPAETQILDSLYVSADEVLLSQAAVDTIQRDSTAQDSTKQGFLQGIISYKAKDYMKMSRTENKIYLYNEAEVIYQDY